MKVNIDKRALQYINSLPDKDRRIVKQHLLMLEDPYTAPDTELLQIGHCRIHITHSYTAFFDVLPGGIVNILKVMTIEENISGTRGSGGTRSGRDLRVF